jgi:hypothetical protein
VGIVLFVSARHKYVRGKVVTLGRLEPEEFGAALQDFLDIRYRTPAVDESSAEDSAVTGEAPAEEATRPAQKANAFVDLVRTAVIHAGAGRAAPMAPTWDPPPRPPPDGQSVSDTSAREPLRNHRGGGARPGERPRGRRRAPLLPRGRPSFRLAAYSQPTGGMKGGMPVSNRPLPRSVSRMCSMRSGDHGFSSESIWLTG